MIHGEIDDPPECGGRFDVESTVGLKASGLPSVTSSLRESDHQNQIHSSLSDKQTDSDSTQQSRNQKGQKSVKIDHRSHRIDLIWWSRSDRLLSVPAPSVPVLFSPQNGLSLSTPGWYTVQGIADYKNQGREKVLGRPSIQMYVYTYHSYAQSPVFAVEIRGKFHGFPRIIRVAFCIHFISIHLVLIWVGVHSPTAPTRQ